MPDKTADVNSAMWCRGIFNGWHIDPIIGQCSQQSKLQMRASLQNSHLVTLFASAFYYRGIQMCNRNCSNIGINPNFIVGVHQHLIDFIRSSILVLGATVDITLGTVVDVDDHVPSHHDDRWWPRWWKLIDGVGWWYWVLGSSWPWERGLKTLLENRWPVNILPDKGDQIFDLTAPLSSTTTKAWKQRKPQNSHGRCSLPLKVSKITNGARSSQVIIKVAQNPEK